MKLQAARNLLVAVTLGMYLAQPATASNFEQLLGDAEKVRSSNPKAFAQALDRIEQVKGDASPSQLRQYRLLKDYQSVIRGDYEAAIKDALAVYKESAEPALKFRAGLLVANTAAVTRDFSLGLRYLENALALQDQVQDAELRQLGYVVAGILYNQYGQFVLGQHYADRVLAQKTSPRNHCIAQQLRIEAQFGLGASGDDDATIKAAIAECEGLNETIVSNVIRGYLARRLAARGDFAGAIELLERHLPEVEGTRYPRLVGEVHGLLAEFRLMRNDLGKAELHAHKALSLGEKDAYSLPLVMAHKVLYQSAVRRNDLETALSEFQLYAEADKARLDEVKAREYAFQLSRHELQQKNQSIELLSRQNEVLRLQQEISRTSAQNNQLLVAMLLMVLGVGAYWAYKIKRVQLMFRRQAQVDSLTGVSNRGHFREQAEAQLARCKAQGKEAALVLLDLDNFKHINDRHGHATGDWVLKQVAVACRAACRDGDLFGRLGGEEFAILTCGGDLHTAERIAQQCREQLAQIDTETLGADTPAVTASYGCATTRLSSFAFETLFMHADRAMYRAKAEGRDRVCVHEERPVLVRTPAMA